MLVLKYKKTLGHPNAAHGLSLYSQNTSFPDDHSIPKEYRMVMKLLYNVPRRAS
ncbi:MAG: hypothetical protein ACTSVV_17820 [Promethearchaeota archaeon]